MFMSLTFVRKSFSLVRKSFSAVFNQTCNNFLLSTVAVVEWLGINEFSLTINGLILAFGSYLVSIIICSYVSQMLCIKSLVDHIMTKASRWILRLN